MTAEQVLEQQVEALEKLLQLKQAIIDELEAKVQRLQPIPSINIPSVWTTPQYAQTPSWQCTDGNPHQYPYYWGSITPPCCTKCGAMAQTGGSSGTISITPVYATNQQSVSQAVPNVIQLSTSAAKQ